MSLAKIRVGVVSLAVALGGALYTSEAHANEGYLCGVHFDPRDTIYGDYGYLAVQIYSGPGCSGSYIESELFCSTGNSYIDCVGTNTYRELALLSLWENFVDAAYNGGVVYVNYENVTFRPWQF